MCVAYFVDHAYCLKGSLHKKCELRCTVFWTEKSHQNHMSERYAHGKPLLTPWT